MKSICRSAVCVLALALMAVASAPAAEGVVNINEADLEQLTLLPRVGETVGQRILDYREANGDFDSVEDLLLVQGIGDKTFELLEPYITVRGETTLTEKVSVARSEEDD